MIVEGFGIKLIRLKHEHIETVRIHRNSDAIRQYMEYRETITPAMQEKWFESVNNVHNNYFVLEYNHQLIGLVYGSKIDWEKSETGNGGIFIWDESFHATPVPLAATLLLLDLSFLLGLKKTSVKILSNNFRAIAFNRNLGYRKKEESPKTSDDDVTNEAYELTEELYKAKAERFRIPFVRMHGDQIHMTLDTPGDASEQNIYSIYCAMPDDKKSRIVMNKLY